MFKSGYQIIKDKFKNNSLLNHASWSLFGSLILRGSGIIAGIFVAKSIGTESFGAYGMFKNFVISLGIFSTFGLGYTATKFIAENKDDAERSILVINNSLRITFYMSVLLSLIIFFFAKDVANTLFKNSELELSVRIVSVWLFFNALTTVQQAILSGFSRFNTLAKINVIIGLISFIASVILAYYYDLIGSLIALLICQIINCLFNYIYIKKEIANLNINIRLHDNSSLSIFSLAKSSFPIALTELNFSFFAWLNSYLIIYLYNYNELGIYNVAMQWYMVILFIPGVLRNVILSTMSSSVNKSKDKILKQMVFVTFISTFLPAMVIYLGSDIITNFYGADYIQAKDTLSILSCTAIISSVSNVYVQYFISNNNFWLVFILRLFYDLLTAVLFYLMSTKFQLIHGATLISLILLATTSVYLILNILLYRFLIKK